MHFRHISAKIQPKNLKQHWLRPCKTAGYDRVSLISEKFSFRIAL